MSPSPTVLDLGGLSRPGARGPAPGHAPAAEEGPNVEFATLVVVALSEVIAVLDEVVSSADVAEETRARLVGVADLVRVLAAPLMSDPAEEVEADG